MTEKEAILKIIDALRRKNTDQDGNWGFPSFYQELKDIEQALTTEELRKLAGK